MNLLHIFQDYILHCHSIGNPIGQDRLSISTENCEDYWLGHYPHHPCRLWTPTTYKHCTKLSAVFQT